MTNFEKIKGMSPKELSEFLGSVTACCQGVGYYSDPNKNDCKMIHCPFASHISDPQSTCSISDIQEYLNSEVTE